MEIKKFNKLNEERTNSQLLRLMVQLSNNSPMTNEMAVLLSNTLNGDDMTKLTAWMKHAVQETETKIGNSKKKFY